jgi:hypothetical protein
VEDLAAGIESEAALLVAIGAPLRRGPGVAVPDEASLPACPESRLYRFLCRSEGAGAHSSCAFRARRAPAVPETPVPTAANAGW